MHSRASTVEQYLAALPADRRAVVAAVRAVILEHLDPTYTEAMQYGMIGYAIPHAVYPAGYHADPRQPLPFAALASQKNHLSLYLMGLYCGCGEGPGAPRTAEAAWFQDAWRRTGKTLDMGKACVRFKRLEDVPLEVVGEAIRRVPASLYLQRYQRQLGARSAPAPGARRSTGRRARSAPRAS